MTEYREGIEWRIAAEPVDYDRALEEMDARVAAVQAGTAPELIWLLDHPPLYTGGTSADATDLRNPRFPVFASGRGGRYTYHGPGQRIGYLVLDLGKRGRDVRCFVHAVEDWVIAALARIDIVAFRAEGRIGIWTNDPARGDAKMGAIGVRVKRWVTMHGFSVNLAPDLSHFSGIVPCGIADYGVTSAAALGKSSDYATFDVALAETLPGFLASLTCALQHEA